MKFQWTKISTHHVIATSFVRACQSFSSKMFHLLLRRPIRALEWLCLLHPVPHYTPTFCWDCGWGGGDEESCARVFRGERRLNWCGGIGRCSSRSASRVEKWCKIEGLQFCRWTETSEFNCSIRLWDSNWYIQDAHL